MHFDRGSGGQYYSPRDPERFFFWQIDLKRKIIICGECGSIMTAQEVIDRDKLECMNCGKSINKKAACINCRFCLDDIPLLEYINHVKREAATNNKYGWRIPDKSAKRAKP